MKKLALIIHLIIALLTLAFIGCTDTPQEPNTDTQYSIDSPPPAGGTLEGIWYDKQGARLSSAGLYDPYDNTQYHTDLRVSGVHVWYTAYGGGYHRVFYGVRNGDRITGTEAFSYWSSETGPHGTYMRDNVFTR